MCRAIGWLLFAYVVESRVTAASADSVDIHVWRSTETQFGIIRLREFGPHDGPLVICIHGIKDNDFIRDEWNPVALRLADEGFHVLVPDFHSAPDLLRPGKMSGESVRILVEDLASNLDGFVPLRYRSSMIPKVAVFGKSWGARMAAEAAALPQVVGVALVAPSFSEEMAGILLPGIKGKLALLMAEDDAVVPISRSIAFRSLLNGQETYVEVGRGGHTIVKEYVEPLAAFAQSIRDRFLHGEDEAVLHEL